MGAKVCFTVIGTCREYTIFLSQCSSILNMPSHSRQADLIRTLEFGHEQAVLHACKYASVFADSVSNGNSGSTLNCSSKPALTPAPDPLACEGMFYCHWHS